MKYLLVVTGQRFVQLAGFHVEHENRVYGVPMSDAMIQNRAEEFLLHSQDGGGLRWLKLEVPNLSVHMRAQCEAVYEIGDGGIPVCTKNRMTADEVSARAEEGLSMGEAQDWLIMADAQDWLVLANEINASETPWFTRTIQRV